MKLIFLFSKANIWPSPNFVIIYFLSLNNFFSFFKLSMKFFFYIQMPYSNKKRYLKKFPFLKFLT
jgi:hypothetical protein